MILRRRAVPLSLLLLHLLSPVTGLAAQTELSDVVATAGPAGPDVLPQDDSSSSAVGPAPRPPSLGKKDAPVDGKDGRPHAGPFVETEAERDRKKAKEGGEHDPGSGSGGGDGSDPSLTEELALEASTYPVSNDGVMDDPNRASPKEGTRGTEGGISEKSRGKKGREGAIPEENLPEEPKEAPPLPHSEQQKISPSEDAPPKTEEEVDNRPQAKVEELELGGLQKPEDLPEKPHNIPHPQPESAASKDPLKIETPKDSKTAPPIHEANGIIQPLHSFLLSLTMIIFSEIGDKTFLVAALMAMKHPPMLVFSAAFAALCVMTVLSALLGHAVPQLLPVRFTSFLAAVLFLIFGAKMLREGLAMSPHDGVGEEMREVEMELEEKEQLARKMSRHGGVISPYALESGRGVGGGGSGGSKSSRKSRSNSRLPAPPESPTSSPNSSRGSSPMRGGGRGSSGGGLGSSSLMGVLAGVHNLFSFLLSPAWVQTFVMTFLGEWGDRSQIATIAMSTGQDYWWVSGGALVGHSLCTLVAVIGGRAIAGRVSLRVVTLGGAIAFVIFGFIYLAESLYYK